MHPRNDSEHAHQFVIPHSMPIDIPQAVTEKSENSPQDDVYVGSPSRDSWLLMNSNDNVKSSLGYRQLLFRPKVESGCKTVSNKNDLVMKMKHV